MTAEEARCISNNKSADFTQQDFDILLETIYMLIRVYSQNEKRKLSIHGHPSQMLIDQLRKDGYKCVVTDTQPPLFSVIW